MLTPPGLYGHQGGMAASASPVSGMMRGSDLHEQAARADVYNSPGWRRLQANQGRHGLRQPSEAKGITIDAEAVSVFSEGDRVFHQKFGYGSIISVEGDKLGVPFRQGRRKARGWPVPRGRGCRRRRAVLGRSGARKISKLSFFA